MKNILIATLLSSLCLGMVSNEKVIAQDFFSPSNQVSPLSPFNPTNPIWDNDGPSKRPVARHRPATKAQKIFAIALTTAVILMVLFLMFGPYSKDLSKRRRS